MIGLVFTAVTAVAAQVASGSRAALGLASGVLGTAFVLRALGDIAESWLRWLSPIGWAQGVRAYADERWWTLGLSLLFAAALVALPAVLTLAGVAMALFGLAPRWAPLAWAALAATVMIGFLGDLLQLPAWSRLASPFHHLPQVPAEDLRVLPLGVLIAVAVLFGAIGLVALRDRDLRTE